MSNQWVKTWRVSEGWSAATLAQRAGIPLHLVESIERGLQPDRGVADRIRAVINAARRERAAVLVRRLCHGPRTTQREVERLLGLSQGYLCRIAAGAGNPSRTLIAALTLLANDPSRLSELAPEDAQPARGRWPRLARPPHPWPLHRGKAP